MTFHPTPETDLDKLQEQLTETPDVSYLDKATSAFPGVWRNLMTDGIKLTKEEP